MDHVASLAERSEITGPVVAWIVVQVCSGQYNAGHTWRWRVYVYQHQLNGQEVAQRRQSSNAPSLSITPSRAVLVPPGSVAKMDDIATMRSLAVFASPFRPAKADQLRQLGPVDRV